MSSPQVRSAFRTRVELLLEPLAFEYIDSINLATSTRELPPKWYTLDFQAASDDRISLGVPALFRETGTAIAFLYSPQQHGDQLATDIAQFLRDRMANWQDLGGHLRVTECAPPNDVDGGDFRGAWYALSVDIRYQFDRLVGDAEG